MRAQTADARPRPDQAPRLGAFGDHVPRWRLTVTLRLLYLDLLMLGAASAATALSAPATGISGLSLERVATFSIVVLVLLMVGGAYRRRFTLNFLNDVRIVFGATAVSALTVTFIDVLFTEQAEAASQAVRQWLFAVVYLAAGRAGFQLVQNQMRKRGSGGEPTLLVGAGQVGNLVAARLLERPEFGLRPVAFLDHDPLEIENGLDLPVIGAGPDGPGKPAPATLGRMLESAVQELGVRHVIVTFSTLPHETELELVRRCQELGVYVSLVPRLFEGVPDQTTLERLGGLPLISVHPSDPHGWRFMVKYALDRVLAAVGIVIAAPVLLACAATITLTMGRPVLFRQQRCGFDGRDFEMLKFRTMNVADPDSTEGGETEVAIGNPLGPGGIEGADRRTRIGSFMRRTSLDELPQLINVLRGEMSLVGPRPERPEYTRKFMAAVPRYGERHRVRSGITGWAQVHDLRGKTSLSDRIEWDNYYIENWSPWLDIRILLMTAIAVFRGRAE